MRPTPESAETSEQAAAIEVKSLPGTRDLKGWLAATAIFPVALAGMIYDLAKLAWRDRKVTRKQLVERGIGPKGDLN
jgi:hypothetical protein